MGKKRIARKRITKNKKSNNSKPKDKIQETNDKFKNAINGNMSKMEYEMSLMDPRFRALMQGFNNPYSSQLNQNLRDRETKNNELSQKLLYQEQISKLKDNEAQLKEQLRKQEFESSRNLNQLRTESRIKELESKLEANNQKHIYQSTIHDLQNEVDAQKRRIQEVERNYNQNQETEQLKFQIQNNNTKLKHFEEILPLKEQHQKLNNELELYKEQYNEFEEQEELKTKIAQKEQRVNEAVREEYNQKLREEKLKTNELQLTNSFAENVVKANKENEELEQKLISNLVELDPNFQLKDLQNTEELRKKLNDKRLQLTNDKIKVLNQLYSSQKALQLQNELETKQWDLEESKAKLQNAATSKNYQAQFAKLYNENAKIQNEIKLTDNLNNYLHQIITQQSAHIGIAYDNFDKFLSQNPRIRKLQEDYSQKKYSDKSKYYTTDMKKIIQKASEEAEAQIQLLQTLPPVLQYPELQNQVTELKKGLNNYGIDVQNLHFQEEMKMGKLTTENQQLHQQNEEYQKRLNQYEQFLTSFPVNTNNEGVEYLSSINFPYVHQFGPLNRNSTENEHSTENTNENDY